MHTAATSFQTSEIDMARNTNIGNRNGRPRLRGLNLAALGPALVVIVYGLGNPPDAMLGSTTLDASRRAFDASDVTTTSVALAQVTAPTRVNAQRLDNSRECAPDEGITDACVYE
jgi:hypothetical protein